MEVREVRIAQARGVRVGARSVKKGRVETALDAARPGWQMARTAPGCQGQFGAARPYHSKADGVGCSWLLAC